MFMMSLLWAAVQQVLVLRSCSGDAVGACVTWGSLEISRRERCTACLVTKGMPPSDLSARGRFGTRTVHDHNVARGPRN
jgi:hypothetical protein